MSSNFKSNLNNVLKSISKAENDALEEIGFYVEAEAKQRCPVGEVAGGTLKRSITNVVDEDKKSVMIGTPVIYAPYVELGTSMQKEKPYLTPSVMENKDKLKAILEKHLKKEVN